MADVALLEKNQGAEGAGDPKTDECCDDAVDNHGEKPDEAALTVDLDFDFKDEDFGPPYQVTIEQKPLGFYFDANYVVAVFPNSHAEIQGVLADSRVVKINDIEIKNHKEDAQHLRTVMHEVQLPFQMTLQKNKVADKNQQMMAGNDEVKSVTKEMLVGLMLAYLSIFLDYFGMMMGIPVLPVIAKEYGFTDQELGLLSAILIAAGIPGGLITLKISEWKGTKFGILYSMFGTAVTLLLQSFAKDFLILAIFRFCAGLTGNSVPVAMTFIGMSVPIHLKMKYFSYVGLTIMFALVVAPTFGGTLLRYGVQVPWQVGAAVSFAGAVNALMLLPNKQIPKKSANDTGKLDGKAIAAVCITFFKFFAPAAKLTMVGNYYIKQFGLQGQDVGYIVTMDGVMNCICTLLFFSPVVKRVGPYWTLMLGLLLTCVSFVAGGLMDSFWPAVIIFTGVGSPGLGFIFNSIAAIPDMWATPSTRAKLNSYAGLMDGLGSAVGSVIWGSVYGIGVEEGVPELIWLAAAGGAGLSLLVILCCYLCIFKPGLAQKAAAAQKALEKKGEHHYKSHHAINPLSDKECLELGRTIEAMFRNGHYEYKTHKDFILKYLNKVLPPLPIDTVEHRLRVVRKMNFHAETLVQEMQEEEDILDWIHPSAHRQ